MTVAAACAGSPPVGSARATSKVASPGEAGCLEVSCTALVVVFPPEVTGAGACCDEQAASIRRTNEAGTRNDLAVWLIGRVPHLSRCRFDTMASSEEPRRVE